MSDTAALVSLPWWGELAGLLTALCAAATGLLIRAYGGGLGAITANALRSIVAGVVFLAIWPLLSDGRPIPPAALVFLVASLVVGTGLGDSLYFAALNRIGVARALPIAMGFPALTTLLAVVVLREQIGPLSTLGIAVTLLGVYLVAAPTRAAATLEPSVTEAVVEVANPASADWIGVAMAVAAAVSWSVGIVLLTPAMEDVDVWTASAVRNPLAAILLLGVATRVGGLPSRTDLRATALLGVAATGVLNVVGTVLFLEGIASVGAARTSVLTATSPIFALPLSVLLLGERATWRQVAGTACSVCGVILLTLAAGG